MKQEVYEMVYNVVFVEYLGYLGWFSYHLCWRWECTAYLGAYEKVVDAGQRLIATRAIGYCHALIGGYAPPVIACGGHGHDKTPADTDKRPDWYGISQ